VKYTPKQLETNVNVSHTSPLKDFCVLAGGLLAICVGLYVILGFCVDFIAPHLPPETEAALGSPFKAIYADAVDNDEARNLSRILKSLGEGEAGGPGTFRVVLVENEAVNAMALPGGVIVVFSGLLEEIDSEEEIAFVLAHELGHYAHRDHLKGMGRGLLLYSMLLFFTGSDSSLTSFVGNSLVGVQMKFSQRQETLADNYALDLMNRRFGRVTGGLKFMGQMAAKEKKGRLAYYFATHPHPEKRIENLKNRAREKNYSLY
jgi:predicted Zn-dependent protease